MERCKNYEDCENYKELLKTVKTTKNYGKLLKIVGGVWPLTDIISSCIILVIVPAIKKSFISWSPL